MAGDTLITLADGSMKSFLEIAGNRAVGEYPLELPVTTWFNNSLSKTMTKTLFVYDCPKVISVVLEDGREIKVTPNHPLMTQDGWKDASKLTVGEHLVVSWPEEFPKENISLSTKVSLHKKAPKTKIKKVSLPDKLTGELAKIIGYQLGEGWKEKHSVNGGITRIAFGSSTKVLLNDWSNAVESVFKVKPTFRKEEDKTTTLSVDSVLVGEFLKQFVGLYELAPKKTVPSQIMGSPREVVITFLAALYDSEGYAKLEQGRTNKLGKWTREDGTKMERWYNLEKRGKAVELRSSSLRLVQQVQMLLSKFRIKSSITQDETRGFIGYKLHIYRKLYIQRFYECIGKETLRIKGRVEEIVAGYKNEVKTQDLNLLKIKEIKNIANEGGKVYDIEVPQTHSFLANNIVSHNSSKTQIAHQLAVNVQLPKERGGAEGVCVYIDSEGAFRPERIKQMAESCGLDPTGALKNVKVARAFNSDHQMLLAEKVEDLIKNDGLPVKLLIVDSLMSHFRADFTGRGMLADRQQKVNKHMHTLMRIAHAYNLVVYVTNQVMSKPDTFFGDPTAAIGGHIVGHNSQTRIYLRKGKKGTRVAKLIDSPHLPDGEAIFNIEEGGVKDV
ncbi:MAG: DNA repair and recombination protein RadA [Candidatus Nanoarchaeia archaeon]